MNYLGRYSWEDYFMVLAIGSVIYFVVIGMKYFRKELTAVVAGWRTIPIVRSGGSEEEATEEDEVFGPEATVPVYKSEEEVPFEDTTDESFREVERLIGEPAKIRASEDIIKELVRGLKN